MIKKFYNTDLPDTGGATTSVAEMMAKHGVINNTDTPVATPVPDKEVVEETPKPPEVTPAATATETSKSETVLETPPPTPTEAPKAEVVQPNWQEVLRNQQPDDVLKELGYDEKAVGFLKEFKDLDPKMQAFLNVWKSGGDIKEYLQELTTDYSKMSAEDVMRHQLRREYPKASQQQLDALYKREVVKAYSLDSVDDDEVEEGKALLEAKADKYRESFMQDQQGKLLPTPPPKPDNSQAEAQAEAERVKQFEAFKSQVTGHSLYREVSAAKSYSVGEGDEKFNFPVDPQDLQDVLFTDKWQENMFDKEGKPNVEHQLLLATVNKYGANFIKELAKHFKSVGGQKAIEPIENASKPDGGTPAKSDAPPASPAEAMARFGALR